MTSVFFGLLVIAGAGAAAAVTGPGRMIIISAQRFLLFYGGVFALIALTAAVAAGLIASDRIVMTPGGRIGAQAVHRAISLAAVGFLAIHIALEIVAARSQAAASVVPFLARQRALYAGLGTIASDLIVVIAATGVLRQRFARLSRPWAWRAVHACAYLAWLLSIGHGLLAGRAARPYVYWSYGVCVAAVALALAVRAAATVRGRREAADPAASRGGWSATPPLLPRPVAAALALPPGTAALPAGAAALPGAGFPLAGDPEPVNFRWNHPGERFAALPDHTGPMAPPPDSGRLHALPGHAIYSPPDGSGPLYLPDDHGPMDPPDDSGRLYLPEDSGPLYLPEETGPLYLPEETGPPFLADDYAPGWAPAGFGRPPDPPHDQSGPLASLPDGLDPTLDWLPGPAAGDRAGNADGDGELAGEWPGEWPGRPPYRRGSLP